LNRSDADDLSAQVDVDAFARDLEAFMAGLQGVMAQVDVATGGDARARAASVSGAVDESQINRLLLDVVRIGEAHGVRFPRCALHQHDDCTLPP
jgi:aarF domain-containing kinase